MKLTPAIIIMGVSFAAFVAMIVLQKFMISLRLDNTTISKQQKVCTPDIVAEFAVNEDVAFLVANDQ